MNIRFPIAALLLAALPPIASAQATKQGTITAINSTPTASCSANSCVCVDTRGIGTVTVQTTGTYTASGGLSGLVTVDGITFKTLGGSSVFKRKSTGVSTGTITSGEQDIYDVSGATGTNFCVSALGAFTGTATVSINTSPATSGGGSSSGGGGTSDATAANQTTQITAEQAIQASAASIDSKIPASPATAANQTTPQAPTTPATATATKSLLVGATYNSSPPVWTNGQQGSLQVDANGNLRTTGIALSSTASADTSRSAVSLPDGTQVTGTISAAIPTATVTISNASPGVVTWTSHGRSVNDPILLTTTGTLPSPLVAGNTVYVKTVLDANTFTVSLTPGGAAINTSSAGSGTHTATASVLFMQDMSGYTGMKLATAPWVTATVIVESSEDQTYWFSSLCNINSSSNFGTVGQSIASFSTSVSPYCNKTGSRYMRVRVTSYGSGTNTVTATLANSPPNLMGIYAASQVSVYGGTGDSGTSTNAPLEAGCNTNTANRTALANGKVAFVVCDTLGHIVNRPWSIPEAETGAAAASGGVANSTADNTLVAAGAAGIRNYLTGIDLMCEALGTATEITIRDGSGGTVLWRTKVGTSGQPLVAINFPNPKKTTAATALIWKAETASGTGACYLNASTFQAP